MEAIAEKQEVKLDRIRTVCKNCVFAIYEGNLQTGCQLGRLKYFAHQDCVINAEDHEKQFFIVNGRNCLAYQNLASAFAKKYTIQERPSAIRDFMRMRLSVIILSDNINWSKPKPTDFQRLHKTVTSLINQKLLPYEVFFVTSKSPSVELYNYLFEKLQYINEKGLKVNRINWRIHSILDDSFVSGRRIDDVVERCQGAFYSVFKTGYQVPENFISNLDEAINGQCERFSLLTANEDGNGFTCQIAIHKNELFNGFREMKLRVNDEDVILSDLTEKVRKYGEAVEKPYLIESYQSIVEKNYEKEQEN